jgi:hypothetical protein
VFPLRRQAAVLGLDGPAVAHFADLALAGVDHRLDGEDHAGHQFLQGAGAAVVQYLRLLVEHLADAVAAELAHYAVAGFFGVLLDRVADVAQVCARLDLLDAQPHALVGDVGQALGHDRRFADEEHAAVVAVVAVLDDGDVEVDHVAVLEHLVARDAVADDVVDRGADGLRVGRVAGRAVVQRRRDRALHVDHVFVAEAIQFAGGHAGLDEGRDVVQHFGAQAAGDAHAGDIFGGFNGDGHNGSQSAK